MQTLDELKAANAAAEADKLNQQPVVDHQEDDQVVDEIGSEDVAEGDEAEAQGEETEEWLKSDSTQAVPLAKHVELKHKLKARLSEKDDEVAQLKAELEQLRAGGVMNQQHQPLPMTFPKLSDFDYDEDKYAEAVNKYNSDFFEAKFNSHNSNAQAKQQQELVNKQKQAALEQHYERAESLVKANKMSAETYSNAELNFRQGLHQVTGNGDQVADEIIARLGDGSAKVIAHLGVNGSAMANLKDMLQSDPTGLKAAVYLGQLQEKFSGIAGNKLSKAPAPDSEVKASAPTGSATLDNMRKAYQAASRTGDVQKAFDLRRKAKASGFNTNNW